MVLQNVDLWVTIPRNGGESEVRLTVELYDGEDEVIAARLGRHDVLNTCNVQSYISDYITKINREAHSILEYDKAYFGEDR